MSLLPTVRRLVTGHNAQGEAIFDSDTQLAPYNPTTPGPEPAKEGEMGFTTIFRTTGIPDDNTSPWADMHNKIVNLVEKDSATIRIVDFAPGHPGLMHRTISVDFGIVLNGEIELELDNGVTKVMKQHDVVVQRGTIHSWNNKGSENVRMLFVLLPANPVKVGDKELLDTPLPSNFPKDTSKN
ncbi:cupin 2 [Nannizzia gypsea CBS 118893]|uniref:Cupin 2 n=1 Tax=Arthroderma gypseum (strain ATCC MYA-4604 / CBS 118893) TaxID=535722 RepID=E4UUD6_ARTGP|nr:cupin 2 [Nannizzia gypsea CBS 118893]EFR00903.1 cupin 2 [Nannizzia gypsea CBS 118893]